MEDGRPEIGDAPERDREGTSVTAELDEWTQRGPDESRWPLEMYLILYPKELEERIIETLEAAGVPGYTEFPKLIGRGRRIKHFDSQIWPGATGAVFTVISA